ncbi:SigB/SigF/SigG family RNA polymerase sigma factor [Phytohabitans houttuyneae]|uniref:RNA polymerase sigma factor n=1 Tax=Phytohabitans houttuyneae TaxID=1076126 RepID=A0A6V8KS41_9ACTN|nr:SigB/SigF/SigG family RNA polymerase sigma factor [Phytohabitans houttuyneae]GFJ85109.1 RNA polymerase sigma factor [Phytohabitans houttuyneae]
MSTTDSVAHSAVINPGIDTASPGGQRVEAEQTTEQVLIRRDALPAGHPHRATLRAKAIEENLPMARRLARRYAGRGEVLDDLAQVAAVALIRAVDRYDTSREVPFVSYAAPTILGALKRHFRESAWAMRVPRPTQELAAKIATATSELTHQRGRYPSPSELAEHLQVSVDGLKDAIDARHAYQPASLDAPQRGGNTNLADNLGGLDPRYAHVDDRLALQPLFAALPPREQRILTMRFYEHMTQTQIADQIGMSQMHVSRLLKQSLARLRTAMPS